MLLLLPRLFEDLFLLYAFLPLFLGQIHITNRIVCEAFLGVGVADFRIDVLLEFDLLFLEFCIVVASIILLTNQLLDAETCWNGRVFFSFVGAGERLVLLIEDCV
jgi:hypothetical protein